MEAMDIREDPLEEEKKKKQTEDYSDLVDKQIPILTQTGLQEGKLEEALESLLALEKKARQAGDEPSTSKVAKAIISLCLQLKEWKQLNESLILISKRRGQFKTTISKVVDEAIEYIPKTENEEQRLDLIQTLRLITEGKIFVENQRAKLTRILASIKEKEGDLKGASKIMQEIQIETYNTMEKRDKIDFILEQMRLCVATNDWIRTNIISRKINSRALADVKLQDLAKRYYHLMIKYYHHNKQWIDVCRSYLSIYNTPAVQSDENQWKQYLSLVVVYVVLSAYDNEQSDLSHNIFKYKKLEKLPVYKGLLKHFLTRELMQWPKINSQYKDVLNKHDAFSTMEDDNLWPVFQKRVVEHNIRVIEKYYSQITLKRMASLLHLSLEETEDNVCELVVSKMIYARINRPTGIISFRPHQQPNQILDNWSHSIEELLKVMEKTCHLVQREVMVHQIKSNSSNNSNN